MPEINNFKDNANIKACAVKTKETEKRYTEGEEFLNAFSHGLGALFAIYAIVMLVVNANTPMEITTTAIYGSMLFLAFQASTCYHAMVNDIAKKVFRKIDHSAIYLLIAGTYTPILMLAVEFPYNIVYLAMIWYLAITGIVFSCLTLKFKHLSTGLYIAMGWLSVFLFYTLWTKTSHMVIIYLLLGGVFFTVGSYFYLRKRKYYHTIWHLFVLSGAISHYLAIHELLLINKLS
ncbi:MAG: hemolysin III family protein [Cyanobacteria bacterium SIG30]|nr:hemolysin III family protein [Cyanobacteria bacterium SIG30]